MSELKPEMDNSDHAESWKEEYRSAISSPSFSHAVNLDFGTRDAGGQFVTPEGALKHKILSSISTEAITAATGQLNPAHGVVGMAGVGKTIALQGLASDKDIHETFPDGIQYISLGQEATVQTAVQGIARAMTMTGASESVAKVENSTSLEEAITHAIRWFQDKKCLFLIDDMWPTDDCRTGLLTDIRRLLQGVQKVGWSCRLAALTSLQVRVLLWNLLLEIPLDLCPSEYSWHML